MIDRLIENIQKKNAPIVVGLDPQAKFIPSFIMEEAIAKHGETLEAMGEAFWEFNRTIIDAVFELIPAVKPQIAMYEQYGLPGLYAYKKTVDLCRERGLVVIGDVKRGDIGSTSESYALGHLGRVKVGSKEIAPFDTDCVTVNPYLGTDGVKPFVDVCAKEDKGIFVLCKTSNPSSGEFQDRQIDGKPLYYHVAKKIEEWGKDVIGTHGYSEVGAVVGATYPEEGKAIREVIPRAYILVPGYGAQGGKGKDLVHFFDKDGLGAIVNSSRGIIAAYKQEKYASYGEKNFAVAARAAVVDMLDDINGALGR